jgi:hypothetical protein
MNPHTHCDYYNSEKECIISMFDQESYKFTKCADRMCKLRPKHLINAFEGHLISAGLYPDQRFSRLEGFKRSARNERN